MTARREPEFDDRRTPLRQAYNALQPLEQFIVQVLSVIYEGVSRTKLLDCLTMLRIRGPGGKALNLADLNRLLSQLTRGGLVDMTPDHVRCSPVFVEEATRHAVREGRFAPMAKIIEKVISRVRWSLGFSAHDRLLRDFRIGLYGHNVEYTVGRLEAYAYQFPDKYVQCPPFVRVCLNPFDAQWLATLPPRLRADALIAILQHSFLRLEPADEAFGMMKMYCVTGESEYFGKAGAFLAEQWAMRGRIQVAKGAVGEADTPHTWGVRGLLDFLTGDDEGALKHYELAIKLTRKWVRRRKVGVHGVPGVLHILALVRGGDPDRLRRAEELVRIGWHNEADAARDAYSALSDIVALEKADVLPASREDAGYAGDHGSPTSLRVLMDCLAAFLRDGALPQKLLNRLEMLRHKADACGYRWLVAEADELLSRSSCPRAQAPQAPRDLGIRSLVDAIQRKPAWERALDALIGLAKPEKAPQRQSRLVWLVSFRGGAFSCRPVVQKLTARGKWTAGRRVALERLYHDKGGLEYLTPQDREVCGCIEEYESYGYRRQYGPQVSHQLNCSKAVGAMIGHPLLFWEDARNVRVELVGGEPELLVTRDAGELVVRLHPEVGGDSGQLPDVCIEKQSPTRLKATVLTDEHRRIAQVLGPGALRVPAEAAQRVTDAVAAITSLVNVQSDVGVGDLDVPQVAADPRPRVHLMPAGQGLRLEILVRPFADGGSYYRPGVGGRIVIAEIDGKRVQTTRDLERERADAAAAVAACQTLARLEDVGGEWTLDDPEDALELLGELRELGDSVTVEWPRGAKFAVTRTVSTDELRISIRRAKDWFSVTGQLKVDDSLVLNMRKLVELAAASRGRFVPLGEGQFLALTRELRRRLDELHAYCQPHGESVRFHPLAALALEELTGEVGSLRTDSHWKEHLARLREARDLKPAVPSTFQAELRDYQVTGFEWLARLAHWGVGACLADDMGLGKTIEALAVILTRAAEGPTLIVAPTSVCMNWHREAERFAPTLNVVRFGGPERRKTVEALGPFDMLVSSYGLLHQEADLLAEKRWQTIVLDEAQAIKNLATKRSKAAMGLQGAFKMITTGTPIENRLDELWNLLRFVNPGLLGTLKAFNDRFAGPIERDGDKDARNKLKKLIQPFILRRTKNQVLEELPPRTEIVLHVEMSEAEAALYEALRREAVERLADLDAPAGQKRIHVLAEIMKLRRACCNPSLVVPEKSIPSSKLAVFAETLDELLQNRHKALVFSQFVDHLTIIRRLLDEMGVTYQYLDGSTPTAQRTQRIDAFQAGQGDVFLISLRAGGLGLNLTAADYVIHMDPWWNPAVEDQASDRAHRIGQQRPVTIYRLVTKDTIEAKIVDLHHRKRDLADSLLEGSDMSGKMSAEDLLRLLKET